MWRRRLRLAVLVAVGLLSLLTLSLALQLDLPGPTGPYEVGRGSLRWTDGARPEVMTDAPEDVRELPAEVWYPAEPGTGSSAPYFPSLAQVADALGASGEVHPLEVAGLPWIRSGARLNAAVAAAQAAFPVVLLSPGNATNVEFYAALAGELASHGYVVVGLNHPYDVAAVAQGDGRVARFDAERWPADIGSRMAFVQERIEVRTEDALFVLDRLEALNLDAAGPFAGRLDLSRVAIMGHSLGGITAAQACLRDARLKACLNLDGLQAGGPFSSRPDPDLPKQPFMFITKEAQLHPALLAQFANLPAQSYRVVLHGASHDSFTDGPLLLPSLLPLPNRADRIHAHLRAYTLAFFDGVLKGRSVPLLAEATNSPQVSFEIFRPD